jgi:hypothetical protein
MFFISHSEDCTNIHTLYSQEVVIGKQHPIFRKLGPHGEQVIGSKNIIVIQILLKIWATKSVFKF